MHMHHAPLRKASFTPMGRLARRAPDRLAEKLRAIRLRLGLTGRQLAAVLFDRDPNSTFTRFSVYEAGTREPSLPVLLAYARLVDIPLETLADDARDLPESLTQHPVAPVPAPRAAAHHVPRRAPSRLPEKLRAIRERLALSQTDVAREVFDGVPITVRYRISLYENGVREPSLPVLLAYARLAGVPLETLVDDALDLPETLAPPPGN
jgi:transcriptional regulator with XRE-family HTH domain